MVWKDYGGKGQQISRYPLLFTPDSKNFFCCVASSVKLINVTTGKEVRVLSGHTRIVTAVVLNPSNYREVFTSSLDGTLRLWNYFDGELLETYNVGVPIHFVAQHPSLPVFYLVVEDSKGSKSSQGYYFSVIEYSLEKKEVLGAFITSLPGCTGLAINETGEQIAIVQNQFLHTWNTSSHEHLWVDHKRDLMTVAFSPADGAIVTGDYKGFIIFWFPSQGSNKFSTKELHWHSNSVRSLTFTADGVYMISGGQETVLVIWQLETGNKHFIPRLGATISSISVSPDSRLYAVLLEDNSIKILNSMSLQLEKMIRGFKRDETDAETLSKVVVDPRSNLLVMNGLANTLQFYNPYNDKFVFELEVAPKPSLNRHVKKKHLPRRYVAFFCFSFDGSVLVTLDSQKWTKRTTTSLPEPCLKFWAFDDATQMYVLHTRVEQPHRDEMTSLVYHPSTHLVVSASLDGMFKTWIRTKTHSTWSWSCRSVGYYKDRVSLQSLAFSSDGSILAASFGNILTLWNPVSNTLLRELTHFPYRERIKKIVFIPNSSYLVTVSDCTLAVWDLLNCSIVWSYKVENVTNLVADPDGNRFLISFIRTNKQGSAAYLLLFGINSVKPLHCWKLHHPAASVAFLSSAFRSFYKSESKGSIVYISNQPELHLLEEVDDPTIQPSGPTDLEPLIEHEPSNFEAMFGDSSTKRTNIVQGEDSRIHNPTLKHHALFDAPSHVLPPLSSLYKSFMETLVIRGDSSSKSSAATAMDVETPEEQGNSQKADEKEQTKEHRKKDQLLLQPDMYMQMVGFFKAELSLAPAAEQRNKKATTPNSKKTPRENGDSPAEKKHKKPKLVTKEFIIDEATTTNGSLSPSHNKDAAESTSSSLSSAARKASPKVKTSTTPKKRNSASKRKFESPEEVQNGLE